MPATQVLIYRDESAGDPGPHQGGGERKNMGRGGGE